MFRFKFSLKVMLVVTAGIGVWLGMHVRVERVVAHFKNGFSSKSLPAELESTLSHGKNKDKQIDAISNVQFADESDRLDYLIWRRKTRIEYRISYRDSTNGLWHFKCSTQFLTNGSSIEVVEHTEKFSGFMT
ncbi:MAG: hypothetical protein R3C03_07765 [Pirellulaceae bacterium]